MQVNVIDFSEEVKSDSSFQELAKEYRLMRDTKSRAEKRMKELQEQLNEYLDKHGKKGSNGAIFLPIEQDVYYVRKPSHKLEINPIMADSILRNYGYLNEVLKYEPQYDMAVLDRLISEGHIPMEDVKRMFKDRVSYRTVISDSAGDGDGENEGQ